MPEYFNSDSTSIIYNDPCVIYPRQRIQTKSYISTFDCTSAIKVSDNPPIENNTITLFSNVTSTTKMSGYYLFRSALFVYLTDGNVLNTDGNSAIVNLLTGDSDDQSTYILADQYKFTRKTISTLAGTPIGFWGGNVFINKFKLRFFCLSISDLSISGSINLNYKFI